MEAKGLVCVCVCRGVDLLCKKGVGSALVQTGELHLNNDSFYQRADVWLQTPEHRRPVLKSADAYTNTHHRTAELNVE